MKTIQLLVLLFAISTARGQLPTGGSIWAVLVAGSNGYGNYRHQSDVCHAYQILRSHGIPDSNIITMMYDDIALNPENPRQGEIINHRNGPNVYDGVLKDYTGSAVTPANFINILLGNETAMQGIGSGKVLKSGPNDHVFVNFVDHGGVGLIAFPYEELYVADWIATLQKMHDANMYSQLTIYMETCESGSMFRNVLPDNINIYATTAANAIESSYACYYDVEFQTYLGDLYSVNWMENSDASNLAVESLTEQFAYVVATTNLSHPQQYGDLTIDKQVVGSFLGYTKTSNAANSKASTLIDDAVPSPEVQLETLKHKLTAAKTVQEQIKIQSDIDTLLANRATLTSKVRDIVEEVIHVAANVDQIMKTVPELRPSDLKCYKEVVSYFSKKCYTLGQNAYALRHVNVFGNMCQLKLSPSTTKRAIDKVCTEVVEGGVN